MVFKKGRLVFFKFFGLQSFAREQNSSSLSSVALTRRRRRRDACLSWPDDVGGHVFFSALRPFIIGCSAFFFPLELPSCCFLSTNPNEWVMTPIDLPNIVVLMFVTVTSFEKFYIYNGRLIG